MKRFLFSFVLFLGFLPLAKAQFGAPLNCEAILKAEFKKTKIKICDRFLDVEIADNDMQRAVGLMCRESLLENNGMLFVFESERTLSFWMKNTKLPLSIGYLDKNKTLIDTYDMQPMSEKSVESSKPATYALETNQGWFKKNNVKAGCKLEFVSNKVQSSTTSGVTKGQ